MTSRKQKTKAAAPPVVTKTKTKKKEKEQAGDAGTMNVTALVTRINVDRVYEKGEQYTVSREEAHVGIRRNLFAPAGRSFSDGDGEK